jgi:hypothetical protein
MGRLKVALLYWDRVRRIVPRELDEGGWVADDNEEARELAEHSLLVATSPEHSGYAQKAAERFFQHVEAQGERFRIDLRADKDLAIAGRSGMHIEKIPLDTYKRLNELGLAERVGNWVSMQNEIASFYMFCLASEMSRSMNAPLFSDTFEDAALGEALLFEPESEDVSINFEVATEASDLLQLGIQLPSPDQMGDIPVKKLVKFSEKRSPERQRFRKAIEGIMGTVRSANDPNKIQDYLAGERENIREAVNDLNKSLTEVYTGALATASKITFPAGVVSFAALPPELATILSMLGFVLGVGTALVETRGKLQKVRTSSPYHYLVSLEKFTGLPPTA